MSVGRQRHGPAARVRTLFSSLSLSLLLWLFAILFVAFAAYSLISFRTLSSQWNETVYAAADRLSEVIKKATHHDMMKNHKEDVHLTIRTVTEARGVLGARIYDKDGVIVFSADERDLGHKVDMVSEACVICHDRSEPLRSVPQRSRVRFYRTASGERALGLINPIENAPGCSAAPCHAHDPKTTILGLLDVKMSMAVADAKLATTRRQAIIGVVGIALLIAATSAVFINRLVRRPVRSLIEGAESIARGDLDTEIRIDSRNEMGQLARAFNEMTDDLREARRENEEWARTLQEKVVERTETLRRTQRQVIHMEKMASLGKLAATVVHELNNPLSGILSYSKLIGRTLEEDEPGPERQEEVARYLGLIHKEAGRCGDVVRNLLLFARRSGAEFARHSINGIVERALMLIRHHLEMAGIVLDSRPLAGDDEIVCDGDQIQQALVALFVNAAEAMREGGTLTVRILPRDASVKLTIADTGPGIPREVLPSIFEPFVSTKEGTSGVGLGLAVVFGIVQRHHGRIDVESEEGHGARFHIVLPRRPPEEARAGASRGGAGERKEAPPPALATAPADHPAASGRRREP